MDCVNLFRDTIQATFGPLDLLPIPDGAIHRFHVPGDKQGTENGAYQLHADGIASGWFGSWKVGAWHHWSSRKPADHLEAQLISQRIEQVRNQRKAELHQRQQHTTKYAKHLWRDARRVDPKHPYLVAKVVHAYGLRQHGDVLLVPLTCDGLLVNLQRIKPDGCKRFLFGGMVKGACSVLGTITDSKPLYLCEGWATGATIHKSTGAAVACAMNAGNLLEVGRRLQRQHPDSVLILAGDDDRQTKGNPGRTAANNAASALGCGLVFPPWSGVEPLDLSDFNDLARWRTAK